MRGLTPRNDQVDPQGTIWGGARRGVGAMVRADSGRTFAILRISRGGERRVRGAWRVRGPRVWMCGGGVRRRGSEGVGW